MAEIPTRHLLLGDPLSEVTRKERRTLLGVSMIGITIVKTGLVPSKISTLGVDFDKANQNAILYILAFVVLYFLVAFVIYATADLMAWRLLLRREQIELAREKRKLSPEEIESDHPPIDDTQMERLLKRLPDNLLSPLLGGSEGGFVFSLLPFWMWEKTPIIAPKVAKLRAIFEFVLPVGVGIYAIILLWRHAPAN